MGSLMRSASSRIVVCLLILSTLTGVACTRTKSLVKRLIGRADKDDDEPRAPPVRSGPAAETPVGPHPRILLDPKTLESLRTRAAANTPAWKVLSAKCTSRMEGPVEWPDGKDYPNPGIGEGYQGGEYWEAMLDLALCGVVVRKSDPARSKAISARIADVLEKITAIEGPHAINPLRDDGFGIRFFVPAMAIGYDWAHEDLSPEIKARVRAAMTHWLDIWDAKGFGRNHAQGNYFAGYYCAKAFAALATQGDFDKSPIWWEDWYARLHKEMVQPYYAEHMAGGGWPEGWNYGAFATINMTWPVWAAHTAKGLDLFRDARAPYRFPFDQAPHLVHFGWPDRVHVDDRGTYFEAESHAVAAVPLSPMIVLPAFLRAYDDPFAPMLQRYAREVRERGKDRKVSPWMEFLYWDPSAAEGDLAQLPRSFVAKGMQTVAMRSSWDESAVWASFTSGTYVGSPESGEMYFDQGSLAVVRGGRPLLVNATSALKRLDAGEPESKGQDPVYEDLFGNHDKNPAVANRTLFNVFYARQKPVPGIGDAKERYGQTAMIPGQAKTQLARFEDKGAYVFMRGERIEDMFRRGKKGEKRVKSWTRQVLYARPSVFVVDDRTEVESDELDQWMAFHLAAPLVARRGEPGVFDSGTGDRFAGTFATLLPKAAPTKTVDVFERRKVIRVEVRPGSPAEKQRWLSVLIAPDPNGGVTGGGPGAIKVAALEGAEGALVQSAAGAVVVASATEGKATYRAPVPATDAAGATHFVTDLEARAEVRVTARREGASFAIDVARGSGLRVSDSGVVAFRIDAAGQIAAVGP